MSLPYAIPTGITIRATVVLPVQFNNVLVMSVLLGTTNSCRSQLMIVVATLEGFEPSISTLKGWRAGPLHHRVGKRTGRKARRVRRTDYTAPVTRASGR